MFSGEGCRNVEKVNGVKTNMLGTEVFYIENCVTPINKSGCSTQDRSVLVNKYSVQDIK